MVCAIYFVIFLQVYIVVGGTGPSSSYLSTTELLYPAASSWVSGEDAPSPVAFVTSVSLEASVLFMGDIFIILLFTAYSLHMQVGMQVEEVMRYCPLMEPGHCLET